MKYYYPFFIFLFVSFFTSAQCECPALPDDYTNRTVVNVSTVEELHSAMEQCSNAGGNYTILLADGEYNLTRNLPFIGTHMVNLTIRGASGNRDAVIIKGKGAWGSVSHIFSVAADNFTAADMTIGWVKFHGIQIRAENDADNSLVQNVRFVDINEQFLKVSRDESSNSSKNGVVQCCLFEFTAGIGYQYYTGGIDAHHSIDWEVRNNVFKHIRSPESNLAEHAIHFWKDSKNALIENNVIINCDRGIGFGLNGSSTYDGIIRNNFVHTSRDVGIGLENSPNTKVYHNTVITENYNRSIEYRFTITTNVHIANNLTNQFITSRNGGTGLVQNNYQTTNLTIYEDSNGYDYHLNRDYNNIVDAGLVLEDAQYDIDCHLRSDGMPDIGADEYGTILSNHTPTLGSQLLQVYPNPAKESISLDLRSSKVDIFNIAIVDNLGRILYAKTLHKTSNKTTENISITHLSPGVYHLVVTGNQLAFSKKITKI